MNSHLANKDYWNERGNKLFYYKGEPFYTVTPIPYYYRRRKIRGNGVARSNAILRDKYETLKALVANGLPTSIPRYLVIDSDVFTLNECLNKREKAIQIQKGFYVIKPVNQRWGKGIEFGEVDEDMSVAECSIVQKAINSEFNPLLVEDIEKNHSDLKRLSQSSLNTLRIITVRTRKRGYQSIFACIRFSNTGGKTDNWSSGGFAACIDMATGICHAAVKKERAASDSIGASSEGLIIPLFQEAKDLAERAHAVFSDMKSIGWDIAITPRGAVIIEGNDDWDVILPQKLMQKGIKRQLCKK